jgi:sulfur-carrier protein adenylyltransferase/sulfurtransferase
MSNETAEITVRELEAELAGPHPPLVLDVREPNEHQIARIPGSTLIPLGELSQRMEELYRSRDIVAHCKMGGRSARATAFLSQNGFRVRNLKGGITAWSNEIDPSVPKY